MSANKGMRVQVSWNLPIDILIEVEKVAKERDIKPAQAVELLVKLGAEKMGVSQVEGTKDV